MQEGEPAVRGLLQIQHELAMHMEERLWGGGELCLSKIWRSFELIKKILIN